MEPTSRTDSSELLGILGGTFDPVHVAHVVAALEARSRLGLAKVLFVVAGDPWQKHGAVVASAEDRVAMVEAATSDIEGLEVSRVEVERSGLTYTVDTVSELSSPDRELFLIVGSDVASRLATWERVDEVREQVTLAVMLRGVNFSAPNLPGWSVVTVPMPRLDVSSTDLRTRCAMGRPIEGLIPEGAVRVLRQRGLYTSS